jgi:glycerol uptake facilitator-like aquaporin
MSNVKSAPPALARRLLAETIGTAALVTVVVGSGIAAQRLSPPDVGRQLLENSTATVLGLGVLILVAAAVGAYIGAAYWFTSSTSFANPAVTIGRMFSDTFAGIAPASVPAFGLAQLVGAALGAGLVLALYPDAAASADAALLPHGSDHTTTDSRPAS